MERQEIINEMMTTHHWSEKALRLALRAGFRCEYCDRDFLASFDDYYAFHREHIVPVSRWPEGKDNFDNLAAACKACNFLKRNWNPRDTADPNMSRAELVKCVRDHLIPLRDAKQKEVAAVCTLAYRLVNVSS